jgi:hypothetical protein
MKTSKSKPSIKKKLSKYPRMLDLQLSIVLNSTAARNVAEEIFERLEAGLDAINIDIDGDRLEVH